MVLPSLFYVFINELNEYANEIIFIYRHRMKVLSNCINDEIRIWNNCGLMMVWG